MFDSYLIVADAKEADRLLTATNYDQWVSIRSDRLCNVGLGIMLSTLKHGDAEMMWDCMGTIEVLRMSKTGDPVSAIVFHVPAAVVADLGQLNNSNFETVRQTLSSAHSFWRSEGTTQDLEHLARFVNSEGVRGRDCLLKVVRPE